MFRKRNDTGNMETNWNTKIAPALPLEIEIAEDRLTAYYRENDGPLWGEANEDAADKLTDALADLYRQHGIPTSDQLYGGI